MPYSDKTNKVIQQSVSSGSGAPYSAEEFVLRELSGIITGYQSSKQQRVENFQAAEAENYSRGVKSRELDIEQQKADAAMIRAGQERTEAQRIPPTSYINKLNSIINSLETGEYVEKNFLGQTVGTFDVADPEGLNKVMSREDFNLAWHAQNNPYPEIREQARGVLQKAAQKFTAKGESDKEKAKDDIFKKSLEKAKGYKSKEEGKEK